MGIQQDYAPNLSTTEVFQFLKSTANVYTAPVIPKAGYSVSGVAKKPVGSLDSTPAGSPIKTYWAQRHWYEVVEGTNPGQVVGHFDAIVPIEERVRLSIDAVLLVADTASATNKTKIESSFLSYQWPRDGDPLDYVEHALKAEPTITRSMFAVVLTHTIEKIARVEHRDQIDRILSTYADRAPGQVWTGPGTSPIRIGDGGYFSTRTLRPRRTRIEDLEDVQPAVRDPIHQVEQKAPQTISGIIDAIVGSEGAAIDCSLDFNKQEWPIMELFEYPEFRLLWRDFSFEIGCGVRVVLTLPVLQIQISKLMLWAYARSPKSVGNIIERVITACAFNAALTGAVVGVVLGNFVAALEAFRGVFTECIKSKLGDFISCLIPGLALISEVKSSWRDI